MGDPVTAVASVIGVGLSAAGILKAESAKAPQVQSTAATNTQAAATADAQRQSALLATSGGASGAVLEPGQVSNRDTLLGN